MALYFPDIVEHNNPDYAALDTDFLRGGTRSPVASLTDLYALYPAKVDLLKERATRVYVSGENKYYVLIDLANADSSAGWAEDNSSAAIQNVVYTTGDQNISGIKTFAESGVFSSGIIVSGNAWFDTRPTVNGSGVMLQGENAGGGQLFTGDITVSIPNGTSFGKYLDGATIPASGLSANDVILMACFNAKEPTLTFTPDSIPFGFSGPKDLALTFGYTINTLGGLPSLVKIESKKATDSTWTELRNETTGFSASPINQTHSINHTLYDTTKLQYRFTVKDNLGGEKVQIFELTPAVYVAPSISAQSIGTTSRYKGDTATTYVGTITKNTNLVPIKSYVLQRDVNNSGTWLDVGSIQNVTANPSTVSISLAETESGASGSVVNANSITYRISVKDEYTISTGSSTSVGALTVTFYHKCGVLHNSSTTINVSAVDSASGLVLQDTKARTITGVTANGMYSYYVYKSSAGALANIVQDDALSVFTSWDRQPDISALNANGASVTYAVYRSKSPGSYTNKKLAFT